MPDRSATLEPSPETLPSEPFAELVARAKDILAGRIVPEPLPTHPDVAAFLEREFGSHDPPVDPETLKQIAHEMSIDLLARGEPVVCILNPGGVLGTVLGVGEGEMIALLDGLTLDEKCKTIVRFP